MLPMMGGELHQLEAIFAAVRPQRVFEWGPGGTSLYLLDKFGPTIRMWVAIEHDPVWLERFNAALRGRPGSASFEGETLVRLVPPSEPYAPTKELHARSERDPAMFADYVAAFDGNADIVLVDGRARNFCVRHARIMQAPLIVIHDAQRPEYRTTLNDARAVFLPGWTGAQLAVIKP